MALMMTTPVESLEESFDEFVKDSAFIDEEVYSTDSMYPMYSGYGSFYVQSPETMDLIRSLPYQLRQSFMSLRKQKNQMRSLYTAKIEVNLLSSVKMRW